MIWGYSYSNLLLDQQIYNTPTGIIDIDNKCILKIFGARK